LITTARLAAPSRGHALTRTENRTSTRPLTSWRDQTRDRLPAPRLAQVPHFEAKEDARAAACEVRRYLEAQGLSWRDIWREFCGSELPPYRIAGDDLIDALAQAWLDLPHVMDQPPRGRVHG
jgi:hypothetical protein